MLRSIIDRIKYRKYNCLDIRYVYDGCGNIVRTIRNDGVTDIYEKGLLLRKVLPDASGVINYEYNEYGNVIKEETVTGYGDVITAISEYHEDSKITYDNNGYELITKWNKKGYVAQEQDKYIIKEFEYQGKHVSWMKETNIITNEYQITTFNIENIMDHYILRANINGNHVYTIYKKYDNSNRLIEEGDSRGIVARYKYNNNGDMVRRTVFDRVIKTCV